VRVDGRRFHELPRRIHQRDLDAGAQAGIEPHRDARAGGRCEQQVLKFIEKIEIASASARSLSRVSRSADSETESFAFQASRTVSASHSSAGRPRRAMPNASAILLSAGCGFAASCSTSRSRSRMPSFRPRNMASARCEGMSLMRWPKSK